VIFRILAAGWRILDAACVDPLATALLALTFLAVLAAVVTAGSLIETALCRRAERRSAKRRTPVPSSTSKPRNLR
jgi:hypothetical protein